MPKPIIKPVSGNKDKQNTYKQLTGKYNKAMRYEFYNIRARKPMVFRPWDEWCQA